MVTPQPRLFANDFASVFVAVDSVRLQGKPNRQFTLPFSAIRRVDYGYTVTSFSSQGSTVDRVMVNDDSMRSSRLVNREQLYVSISRGRIHARIYTNDAEALRLAISPILRRNSALDSVKQRPTQELKAQRNTANFQPQQPQNQSIGMRI
jgi:hypothetical protein